MPRIAGVDIPDNKRVDISLTYIYGIGPKISRDILKNANIEAYLQFGAQNENIIRVPEFAEIRGGRRRN